MLFVQIRILNKVDKIIANYRIRLLSQNQLLLKIKMFISPLHSLINSQVASPIHKYNHNRMFKSYHSRIHLRQFCHVGLSLHLLPTLREGRHLLQFHQNPSLKQFIKQKQNINPKKLSKKTSQKPFNNKNWHQISLLHQSPPNEYHTQAKKGAFPSR